MSIIDRIRADNVAVSPREPRFTDLEEGIREKVTELSAQTPTQVPPSLDNVSDLVAKGITALVSEHKELLDHAKELFTQVEHCLESATKAREEMLAARQEALGK